MKTYVASGIDNLVDHQKLYIYSIVTHSTTIQGEDLPLRQSAKATFFLRMANLYNHPHRRYLSLLYSSSSTGPLKKMLPLHRKDTKVTSIPSVYNLYTGRMAVSVRRLWHGPESRTRWDAHGLCAERCRRQRDRWRWLEPARQSGRRHAGQGYGSQADARLHGL